MRVAALYDIHGNLPALEAVLAEVGGTGADVILLGGDIVGGPMPAGTLAALEGRPERLVWIRGNGERELAEPTAAPDFWTWAGTELHDDQRDFLVGLPTTVALDVEGLGPTLFCHGSPRRDNEILTRVSPEARVAEILSGVEERIVVCGHTHTQFDRVVGDIRLVNSGSVGMPYEDEPGAYWTVLGPDVELRRTPYDLDAAAARIRETEFPIAEEFASENVLTVPSGDEAAALFESQAEDG
ncbi:MAG TPA: metallophosphoesterase family protein [Gaiellaceae bacterium]